MATSVSEASSMNHPPTPCSSSCDVSHQFLVNDLDLQNASFQNINAFDVGLLQHQPIHFSDVDQINIPTVSDINNGTFLELISSFPLSDHEDGGSTVANPDVPLDLTCKIVQDGAKDFGGKKRKNMSSDLDAGFENHFYKKNLASKTVNILGGKTQTSGHSCVNLKQAEAKHPQPQSMVDSSSKEDYIHMRAKRGQATNSHSLAERLRREKISERMRYLQNLVPGCNKITGKAVMLDEIINYVQSLQSQVEFLSMKLSTVNSELSIDVNQVLANDILETRYGNPGATTSNPHLHYGIIPQTLTQSEMGIHNTHNCDTGQTSSLWDDELQNVLISRLV